MAAVRWLSPVGPILGCVVAGVAACRTEPPARARVELSAGPMRGAYQVEAQSPSCSHDLLGPGSWGVQLTDWAAPKEGLRSLQLIVPSESRPGEFYLGLVFGDLFAGTVYEIETRPAAPRRQGRGFVAVVPARDQATVRVNGFTRDSVAVTAIITCALAQEAQGEEQ